jgi:hypothetical protein
MQPGTKPPALPDSQGLISLAKYVATNLPKRDLPGAGQLPLKQEKAAVTTLRQVNYAVAKPRRLP